MAVSWTFVYLSNKAAQGVKRIPAYPEQSETKEWVYSIRDINQLLPSPVQLPDQHFMTKSDIETWLRKKEYPTPVQLQEDIYWPTVCL